MYSIIYGSLSRQHKALVLLRGLLEEEYRNLLDRQTETVVSLEFSIQELIRQLAVEKTVVMKALNGVRVAEYATMLPDEQRAEVARVLRAIDAGEQGAARQASRNATLSLGLLDQSSRTLQALTHEAVPNRAAVYGRSGAMRVQRHAPAAFISGRL